jgi:hypothetical protein
VAARLHVYNAFLNLKSNVRVRSALVLLRPKADNRKLSGKHRYLSGGHRVIFEYEVIRLWQRPVDEFVHGPVGLLPLATLCKMPPGVSLQAALRQVIADLDRRLCALPEQAKAVRLMSAAHILTTSQISRRMAASVFAGVKIMHTKSYWDEVEVGEPAASDERP